MKFNFKEAIDSFTKFTDEHKSDIATGAGLALLVGGTVVAVIAAVKTTHAVAEAKEEKLAEIASDMEEYENLTIEEQQEYDAIINDPLPFLEVLKLKWPWWTITILLEALGIFCIIFSDKQQAKTIASLTTKVSTLAFQAAEAADYKDAAKEILGDKKEKEIDTAATKRNAKRRGSMPDDNLPSYGTGIQRYQEWYSGQKFWADPPYIDDCVNQLNHRFNVAQEKQIATVPLYEWFDILNLSNTPGCGDELEFDLSNGLVDLEMYGRNSYVDNDGLSTIILKFTSRQRPQMKE